MPLPSVEPIPPVPLLSRFCVPLEAQDASYFAASERMASLRCSVRAVIFCSRYVHFSYTASWRFAHTKKTCPAIL